MVDDEILLPNACRCCLLEDKDMVYVFDVLDEFEMQISDLIARNGAVTILESDCFSKHICGNCLNDLAIAERFILRCRKTNDLLQNLTQTQLDPNSDKVSYVLMTEPLYVEQTTPEPSIEGFEDIIQEDAIENEEPKTTEEFDTMYCISEEEEAFVEDGGENIADQQGLIIKENLVLEEDDEAIITEEAIEVDEVVYCNLFQNTTTNVVDSDDLSTDLIDYEEHLCHGENDVVTEVDDEFDSKTSTRKMADFKHNCGHCGASFVTTQNYARHLKTHSILACPTCLAHFPSEKDLSSHVLQCQQRSTLPEIAASELPVADIQPTVTTTSDAATANASGSRKKALECSYCSKRWPSQSALAAHLRTHTGERPFGCNICPKRFKTMAGLDLHERRHTGAKPYNCSVCDKRFAESSNLKVHMRQHTREKPHVCTVCNRAFARVFLLQLHQRTHTGERPYGCEICGKSFSQQGDLAVHRRIHSGERPFVCSVCGRGFIKSTALRQHRISHEKHLFMGSMAEEGTFRRLADQELESS